MSKKQKSSKQINDELIAAGEREMPKNPILKDLNVKKSWPDFLELFKVLLFKISKGMFYAIQFFFAIFGFILASVSLVIILSKYETAKEVTQMILMMVTSSLFVLKATIIIFLIASVLKFILTLNKKGEKK